MKTIQILVVLATLLSANLSFAKVGQDRGGGNGLYGKPLESFAKHIEQEPAFESLVNPVLQQLSHKLPGLYADLEKVIAEKNVYIIPVRLPTIPSYIIGVSFHTEQLALQTDGSIWIDDDYYNNMQTKDQAYLLMHELVMGVRLRQERAFMAYTTGEDLDLGQDDYEAVRRLTYVLVNDLDTYSTKDFHDFVVSLGFPNYPMPASVDLNQAPLIDKLYQSLKTEDRAHALPYATKDGAGCVYEFSLNGNALDLSIYDSVNGEARRDGIPFTATLQNLESVATKDGLTTYSYTDASVAATFGAERKRVDISLNGDAVISISAYWEQYGYDYRDRTNKWNATDHAPGYDLAPAQKLCTIN